MITNPIKVGPDGFVRLVDRMGDDSSIVQAARISYGAGTKAVSDDRTLIRYLMRHRHTTPFEMVEFKFHVRCPMDVWRQWIRHRTASVNEYSTRYSEAIDARATTEPDAWRLQSSINKQGSADFLPTEEGQHLTDRERAFHEEARLVYHLRLDKGIAREQARKDLPLSTYTEAYWKLNLHNLFHFLELRLHPHAQGEIRAFAEAVSRIVMDEMPVAWEAFCDYRLDGLTLSGPEVGTLARLLNALSFDWRIALLTFHEHAKQERMSSREVREFHEKLEFILGVTDEVTTESE